MMNLFSVVRQLLRSLRESTLSYSTSDANLKRDFRLLVRPLA